MRVLETSRLFLRTWKTEDFALARSLWGDPDVMTFLGGPLSDAQILEKMRSEMSCAERHGVQYWPIFEKETDEFAGCCGLRPWAYTPPAGHETGFALIKAKWGRGYASEISRAVVKHAFETLRLPMLRAGHHPEHRNSRKILLKLGFEYVDDVLYKPTGLMHPTYQLKNESTRL